MLKRLDEILRQVFHFEKIHEEEVARRIAAEKRQKEFNDKVLAYFESEEYKTIKALIEKNKTP